MLKSKSWAVAIAALLLTTACASEKIKKSDISPTANPTEEIQKLDQSLSEGVKNHADILAPEEFEKAKEYTSKAKEDFGDKKDQSDVIESISYATSYIQRSRELADDRRGQIQGVLDARSAAMTSGATEAPKAKEKFSDLDREISKSADELSKVKPDELSRIQREYMALETEGISNRELGAARAAINSAEEGDAKKRVPKTLALAQVDLRSAENILAQNAKNPETYRSAVEKANTSAQFLTAVHSEARKNGEKTTEDVAIKLARQNQKINSLQSNLGEAQGSLEVMGATVASQNQLVRLQQSLEKARKEFSKDEAQVFQQGDTLLIRLKKMNFAVNRSELPQESLETLAKVKSVIEDLGSSKVVVEGHTDSTGGEKVNQAVSQARADAVAKYLTTNGVAEEAVVAKGYGFSKPLASNKSKATRAQNRRVDVIITASKDQPRVQGQQEPSQGQDVESSEKSAASSSTTPKTVQ